MSTDEAAVRDSYVKVIAAAAIANHEITDHFRDIVPVDNFPEAFADFVFSLADALMRRRAQVVPK